MMALPNHVSGADLHKYAGHLVAVEGVLAHLLWADPENNGLLLRVRTAERGREYLVRANTYTVSDEPEPILDDDAADRWDNEPPLKETPPAPIHEIDIRPYADDPDFLHWLCSCGTESDPTYAAFGIAASEAVEHVPASHALMITRPYLTEGGADRG